MAFFEASKPPGGLVYSVDPAPSLTQQFLNENISVMEMLVRDVAEAAGVTPRYVSAAIQGGALSAHRRLGRTVTVNDLAMIAWGRSRGRGRRWTEATRQAAFDLASSGSTEHLHGSRLSRLRGVLRDITAQEFASLAAGLGGQVARYKSLESLDHLDPIGPSAIDRGLLGIGLGELRFVRVDHLEQFEVDHLVQRDADGDLIVVERETDPRSARVLLDTYLLGTGRESHAAAQLLEQACHGL